MSRRPYPPNDASTRAPRRREVEPLAHVCGRARRAARDERHGLRPAERAEAPAERKAQRALRVRVRVPNPLEQRRVRGELAGVCRVDPIPREVAERDGWHARVVRREERERRDVTDDQRRAELPQQSRVGRRPVAERGCEGVGARYGFARVETKAVDLHHPRVALGRQPGDRRPQREVEEPARRRRPHDDGDVRRRRVQRVDDLDVARRVAEPVA